MRALNGQLRSEPVEPITQEEMTERSAFFGLDRNMTPVRFAATSKRRPFLRRVAFILRALPRLVRDAWRDSRFE